jgi:metal-responsive CopG/Arc/MetJ family transcriptional regulator
MAVLMVNLDDKLYQRLQKAADKNKQTESSIVTEMLELYLADYEADDSAGSKKKKKSSTYISSKEVENELDL